MSTMLRRKPSLRSAVLLCLTTIPLAAGCASTPRTEVQGSAPVRASEIPAITPIIRYGRYTLVELRPDASQEDLLSQVIDITLPASANASVGEALRYLLLRSGYQLCAPSDAMLTLSAFPLPAAHLHLGPLTLRGALQVLVGRAWTLQVNESTRTVCFAAVATSAGAAHAAAGLPLSAEEPSR
jgi:conjugative transfer region protein (TIGR03748 family)